MKFILPLLILAPSLATAANIFTWSTFPTNETNMIADGWTLAASSNAGGRNGVVEPGIAGTNVLATGFSAGTKTLTKASGATVQDVLDYKLDLRARLAENWGAMSSGGGGSWGTPNDDRVVTLSLRDNSSQLWSQDFTIPALDSVTAWTPISVTIDSSTFTASNGQNLNFRIFKADFGSAQEAIALDDITLSTIPEPTVPLLALMGSLLLLRRRR